MNRNLAEKPALIKWRSHEPSRLETFSDAVFAFAVTLIIVALEVPESFHELKKMMHGFFSFAICFLMLFQIWNIQNVFFRRFGLRDNYTLGLNAVLLFTVLFYVYPLKFLFSLLFSSGMEIERSDFPLLMIIYGGGYFVIFFLFYLMYANAASRHKGLDLTESELFHTNTLKISYLLYAIVGIISCVAALVLPVNMAGLSGFVYFLLGPFLGTWHFSRAKKQKLIV